QDRFNEGHCCHRTNQKPPHNPYESGSELLKVLHQAHTAFTHWLHRRYLLTHDLFSAEVPFVPFTLARFTLTGDRLASTSASLAGSTSTSSMSEFTSESIAGLSTSRLSAGALASGAASRAV